MDASLLLKGLALGFSIAAPVGPIGVLCIRRTLAEGRLIGFVSGLGAAAADTLYGCVAAFGLTAVSGFLVSQKFYLQAVGALFLLYMGLKTLTAKPSDRTATAEGGSPWKAFLSTFSLTVTNPMTILSFAAVFAGLGLAKAQGTPADAGWMVGGIFLGSALWWLMLSLGVGAVGRMVDAAMMRRVNVASGAIILGFAGLAIATLR